MKYGICLQSMVAVRKQPSDVQEMINQLLLGDLLIIEDQRKNWLLIQSIDDQYNGWVDEKQIYELDKEEFDFLNITETYFALENYYKAFSLNNKTSIQLSLGSRLPNFTNKKFLIGNIEYNYSGKTKYSKEKNSGQTICELAQLYLGAPYLWGGRSLFGIDCSGLVQVVFKMCGIKLPRDSSDQAGFGHTVNFIDGALPGDLAFFDNEEDKIIHVGIVLGNNQIIHASGEVRIDKIDHYGIYNENEKKYSHKLRIIKRVAQSTN